MGQYLDYGLLQEEVTEKHGQNKSIFSEVYTLKGGTSH